MMGWGKALISSHRSLRAYNYYYWDTHGSLCEGESQYMEQYNIGTMELPYAELPTTVLINERH